MNFLKMIAKGSNRNKNPKALKGRQNKNLSKDMHVALRARNFLPPLQGLDVLSCNIPRVARSYDRLTLGCGLSPRWGLINDSSFHQPIFCRFTVALAEPKGMVPK